MNPVSSGTLFLGQNLARQEAQVIPVSGEGTLESEPRTETPVSPVRVALTEVNLSLNDERRMTVVQKKQKICVNVRRNLSCGGPCQQIASENESKVEGNSRGNSPDKK